MAKAGGEARESARALARAKATGKSVPVPSLTTPNSTTVANPRGTFTLTQTAEPARMRRAGRWVDLDPRLHVNGDKSLSPNAVSSPVRLSGGGNGPLATMTHLGRTLSFTWPTSLPVPAVKGPTATYLNVLPSVDLVVTVSSDGGFSDVLVVKTKQAAADPRLAQLTLATKTSGGLVVATDAAGNLTARTSAKGATVFSAPAPRMWDSATAKATPSASPTASPKVTSPKISGGKQHGVQSEPSTVQAPGTHAHIARIKATASQPPQAGASRGRSGPQPGSLTLVPDRSLLTGASTVFPVYIDPRVGPGSKYSISVSDHPGSRHDRLQVGYCGWADCGGAFKARSFLRVNVDSKLRGATILGSELNFPFAGNTASGCTAARVTHLWWTDGISSSTSWPGPGKNNFNGGEIDASRGSWGADCTADQKKAGAYFDLQSFMQAKATGGAKTLTFGMFASETDTNAWRQFDPDFTMSTEYNHAPGLPGYAATLPGGPCKTDPASTIVGNDDVTLQVVPTDQDGGQLTTKFVVANAGGSVVYDSSTDPTVHSPQTTAGKVAQVTFPRSTFRTKWHADGATQAYRYTWYTQSTDGTASSPLTGLGSKGSPCGFTYDPVAPQSPAVQPPTDDLPMGQPAAIPIAPCATALDTPPEACTSNAARYIYQVNDGPTTRITATGTSQTISLTPTHVGVNTISVTALSAAGNPSPATTSTFTVAAPATPSADGDIDRDGKSDLLTVGTGSTNPGMWLATSNGAGGLATPTDVGALGTGISIEDPNEVAPAQWNGATVLHGSFTGNNVQDVIAYYPAGTHVGNTKLLYGTGDGQPLNPYSGDQLALLPDQLMDDNGNVPIQMVAAGNASRTRSTDNPTIDDLATISGDPSNGYTLNLVTGTSFDGYNDPNAHPMIVLAPPGSGPGAANGGTGAATWDKYRLLAAQPIITVAGQPTAQTHLYALDTTTGSIWEAVNTTDGTTTWGTVDTNGIPVQPTWTKLTVPWTATTIPNLISADLNTAGKIELWGTAGLTATNYTLTGTTITKGASASLLAPAHAWPLTDGGTALSGVDTNGASPAQFSNTGVSWVNPTNEQIHATAAQLDGTNGYIALPSGMLSASNVLTLTLSFQAQPGTNGILFSTGTAAPDQNPPSANAMPVMYIGTDGRLYAQFWNGTITPMISPQPVNDGQWHTATLVSQGNYQGFYLDNNIRIGMAGSNAVINSQSFNSAGAGVFNTAAWVNAPGDTTKTRTSHFTGLIANIAYYVQPLTMVQLAPIWKATTMTGPIVSGLTSALCIDDAAPHNTNNDKIQIYTCNGSAAQTWNINPDGTITLPAAGKCLDITGNGTANGTKIDLYTCVSGAPNQQWHLDSSGQIWNPQANRCLDDPSGSTTNGTQLQIYDCNLTKAQYWIAP